MLLLDSLEWNVDSFVNESIRKNNYGINVRHFAIPIISPSLDFDRRRAGCRTCNVDDVGLVLISCSSVVMIWGRTTFDDAWRLSLLNSLRFLLAVRLNDGDDKRLVEFSV